MLWINCESSNPDAHAAFRGHFELERDSSIVLEALGASSYILWCDGRYVMEGPARFVPQHPQYTPYELKLSKGKHVIAVHVHYDGVETRILRDIPPFIDVRILHHGRAFSVQWKCSLLQGHSSQVRRSSQSLGWIEWCDTRKNPAHWQFNEFDDHAWQSPVEVRRAIGKPIPLDTDGVKRVERSLTPCASGMLAERFGYEQDDIPARFFLRDLDCDRLPPGGVWRRYDLGRVRLGRPRFVLDLPEGAVVEFACCEWLAHGRVHPYVGLTGGLSCYLDHFTARGGRQEFSPFEPRGGRFLEVHVLAPPGEIAFIEEAYCERCYWERTEGAFRCDNEKLNDIWNAGARTLRACAEDAVVDCPTRERGQWTGDSLSVGLRIGAYAFSDLRLFRRVLTMSAQCAREDGLVAAACPGHTFYMPCFSLIWVSAALKYHELTGERLLLEHLFDAAIKNMEALARIATKDGLLVTEGTDFLFVDWGYERNDGPCDMATNLFYLSALRGMAEWCARVNKPEQSRCFDALAIKTRAAVRRWFDSCLHQPTVDWEAVGYHRAVLAILFDLLDNEEKRDALSFIKRHIVSCFPNNPDAPRNDYPQKINRNFITPYFFNWALEALIEHGEMDFVLDQYLTCWGYLLEDGRTTLMEVFDERWSHCHHWSGCPTWQLSRYCLGLYPQYDKGMRLYLFDLQPGHLQKAHGAVPLREGGVIEIAWTRAGATLTYQVASPTLITIRMDSENGQTVDIDIHGTQLLTFHEISPTGDTTHKSRWVLIPESRSVSGRDASRSSA